MIIDDYEFFDFLLMVEDRIRFCYSDECKSCNEFVKVFQEYKKTCITNLTH